MRILGIDPGYAIVGYAILDSNRSKMKLVSCGVIETFPKFCFTVRLQCIFNEMKKIISDFSPDCMSIESLYFQNNQKTAINVAHARGVILLASEEMNVPIFEYTPLQAKISITGFGRASKNQMIMMTKKLLNMENPIKPDDAADAVALAICHSNVYKFKKMSERSIS